MKNRLMTPGPVEIPPEVLLEMAQPIFHHRTPRHKAMVAETIEHAHHVFQTQADIVILAASGTGGMEASVVNLLQPGDKALTVNGGKFGERWGKLAALYGADVVQLDVEWGLSVDPQAIRDALQQNPDIKAVYTTLSETSTGAATDIKAIGEIVAQTDAVLVVDGISSVGAMELRADEWGVDVVVGGSQKAFLIPPGLAILSISPKAKARIQSLPTRCFYFDLKAALDKAKEDDFPFTPAITLIRALNCSLAMLHEEGMPQVWARHERMAAACRAGLQAIGFAIFPQQPACPLTVARVPEGVDGGKLVKALEADYGFKIAGGQEALKGKIVRVSNMGYIDEADLLGVLSAIERSMRDMGQKVDTGAGVAAAQQVIASA